MRKPVMLMAAMVFAAGSMMISPQDASARKEYMDAFNAKYDIEAAKEQKCNLCHAKKSKKERSDYAKAMEKALGAKMVKDKDKINESLTEIEKVEYETGKTYGALLKDGKIPKTVDGE